MRFGLALTLLAGAPASLAASARSAVGSAAPQDEGLRAGFARVDITPPPGLGLQGWGSEGREALGYRQRLYARALALVDAQGERLAIVIADLQAISPSLHVESLARATHAQLQSHELLLAATHTHAAPSHYFDAGVYNENGSSILGFDAEVLTFLARCIALALDSAFNPAKLRPARVAWGSTLITGVSRNRSYEAYLANTGPTPAGFPAPLGLAVDRTWTMLRVDTLRAGTETYIPAGAFSVFGVHSTVIPPVNDLYDSDVHGYVSRRLEQFIDSLAGISPGPSAADPRPRSVHLWANGAQGDVSPTWRAETRCQLPRLTRGLRPSGARAPRAADDWDEADEAQRARCVEIALADLRRIGDAIAARVEQLFVRLGNSLSDTLTISRASRSLRLPGLNRGGIQRLPAAGLVGSSVLGGGEDGRTRYYAWRDLGVFSAGFEEGLPAQDPGNPDPLQRPKRQAIPLVYRTIVRDGLPKRAHLMLVRFGDRYLAAAPAEVTTVAAHRITRAVRLAAQAMGRPNTNAILVGLANGYLLYLTTAEEYGRQHYEGGSNLYGHQTLSVFEDEFAELTRLLPAGSALDPVQPVIVRGHEARLLPRPTGGGPDSRHILTSGCDSHGVRVRWEDEAPGDLVPSEGLLLRLSRTDPAGQTTVLWDDDPRVEVSFVGGGLFGRGKVWQARFLVGPDGDYELTLHSRKRTRSGPMYPELSHRFTCR